MEKKKQPKSAVIGPVRVIRIGMNKDGIKVVYPKVVGMRNKHAEAQANKALLGLTRQMTDALKDEGEVEIAGGYDVIFNDRGLLSVLFEQYPTDRKGERLDRRTLTVKTETGAILALQDLFKEGSYYKTKLSRMIKEEIKAGGLANSGSSNLVKGDQDYILTAEGIVIFLDAAREFLIPYTGNAGLLAGGPLAELAEESVTKVKRL